MKVLVTMLNGLNLADMHCSEDIDYGEEDSGGADSIVQASRLLVRSSSAYDIGGLQHTLHIVLHDCPHCL